MGGCFSKPKPVELKIEVVLPEKDRGKEELSAGGKGSPRAYQGNGTARHFHAEERLPAPHPYPGAQDCLEAAVCHIKDLENGQMREVELGWGKVLLVKDNGEFHALGHKCPHYGAPLVKGVLSRGRVRCPWHGACFNISTGDLEDFPGLDSLHKFQVKIEKEKVYVRASKQALQLQRRTKVMATCISPSAGHSSSTNVLIVGAGAAGLVCAETLRQEGFSDRIVLCTLDRHLPYDRPKLSKSLDAQLEQLALRPKEFFRAHGIEVLTEAQVVTVDVRNKKAVFKDGFKLEYSKLLLAPGSSPKTLSCKGKDVENVFTIRTPEDANRVVRLARGRNAVVVGAGFLGMEVAAYLTEKAHSVSVVELEETPFRRFLGERVGRALMKMFESNRVKFYMQTEVSELRAQDGKLKEVVLKSSKVLRADVCVVGIDDADQCPGCVCSWRRCDLPPGLEEQSESEHPTLADGSCPGYHQPCSSLGWEAVPESQPSPGQPPQLLALGPAHWVSHSRLCGSLSSQPHAGGQGGSQRPPISDLCPVPSRHPISPATVPHLAGPSTSQPLLSFCPQRHMFCRIPHQPVQSPREGERGLVEPGPAPYSTLWAT
ncbi:apoptosis-inducing factor 3 isoform X4 [Phocoena sinus]|uniref:apoptosis-inducing factor 3 isoform X4 n=1 Tax=Phocoena sinus TaxID=42100 RepID=UPI0013C4CE19|nr:apoptosis-inducing factor 3 isoform X4 [Phocoena sinus]